MEKGESVVKSNNPLATSKVTSLIVKFSIPSIIAMLVGSLYNIVDQYFIGRSVGQLGNGATNIAFPLSMLCTAIALLSGIGGASNFNLSMGRGEKEKAGFFIGNAIVMLTTLGMLLMVFSQCFLKDLLILFGSTEEILPYALTYVRITSLGFPFLILTIGSGHLIRADGSPKMAMLCNMSGAVINTLLDYIFVMKMDLGMEGAAWATVLGQVLSMALAVRYLMHYKTVKLERIHFIPRREFITRIAAIGAASAINQMAMMFVQIVLNNSLKHYGALSVYGPNSPIAVAGIVTKVFQVFFAVIIGLSQGSQPIISFNYGATNFARVKEAYLKSLFVGSLVASLAFILFHIIPRQLIGLFGDGDEAYFEFGVKYFQIYMFMVFINFLQPISSTFFTSIGKSIKGVFLSLTRQIIYLLPLILLLPLKFGIDGILFSGPIADTLAAFTTFMLVRYEFGNMKKLEEQKNKI